MMQVHSKPYDFSDLKIKKIDFFQCVARFDVEAVGMVFRNQSFMSCDMDAFVYL